MPQDLALHLEQAVDRAAVRLRAIPETEAARKPSPRSWSRKEELGHLLDSATNNHVRFVRASLEPELRGPGYDGDGWVSLHGYQEMAWADIIAFWQRYNAFMVKLVTQIPDAAMDHMCEVGEGQPMTLQALIEDYIRHMQHHLDHILGDAWEEPDRLGSAETRHAAVRKGSAEEQK